MGATPSSGILDAGALRSIRESRGLSQQALARLIGRSCSSVEHYESARRNPAPATLALIAAALDVDPAELLELETAS